MHMHNHIYFYNLATKSHSHYNKLMSNSDNKTGVSSLIDEATRKINGGNVHWYERIPAKAIPFIETLSKRVATEGTKANARIVSEILEREYDFVVSRSRVRLWLADLEKQYAEKN